MQVRMMVKRRACCNETMIYNFASIKWNFMFISVHGLLCILISEGLIYMLACSPFSEKNFLQNPPKKFVQLVFRQTRDRKIEMDLSSLCCCTWHSWCELNFGHFLIFISWCVPRCSCRRCCCFFHFKSSTTHF